MELKQYIQEVAKKVLGWFPQFERNKFSLTLDKIVELISDKEQSIKKYGHNYKYIDKVGNAIEQYNNKKTVEEAYNILKDPVEYILYISINSTVANDDDKEIETSVSLKDIAEEVIQEQKNIEEFFDYE